VEEMSEEEKTDHEPQGFFVYGSVDKLVEDLVANKPLSVVLSTTPKGYEFYCCCKGGKNGKQAIEIKFSENVTRARPHYEYGLLYDKIGFPEDDTEDAPADWDEIIIRRYGLFLPHSDPAIGHALITSDWTVLNPKRELDFPRKEVMRRTFYPFDYGSEIYEPERGEEDTSESSSTSEEEEIHE